MPTPAAAATPGGYPWKFVMLGDSYAAGEGVNPAGLGGYYSDSDTPDNQCHRSSLAYGPLLTQRLTTNGVIGEGQWIFPACSGDRIENLTTTSGNDRTANPASQLSYLGSQTTSVTVQIGGNDIDFAGIAAKCSKLVDDFGAYSYIAGGTAADCRNARNDALGLIGERRTDADSPLRDELVVLYRQILQQAPNAHLTVLTYPRLLPNLGEYTPRKAGGVDYCVTAEVLALNFVGFDSDTATRLAGVERRLNDKIAQTVNGLRDHGLAGRMSVVRLDTEPGLEDHPFDCKDPTRPAPYVQGVNFTVDPGNATHYVLSKGSFHPNEAGHAAFADAAYTQAANVGHTRLVVPNPVGSTVVRVGGVSHLSFSARNGNPIWVPAITDPAATPSYQLAVSRPPTAGITVAGEPADLMVTAGPSIGRFRFDVTATDEVGATATHRTWVDVVAGMSITTESLPTGSMNAPYEAQLAVDAALGRLTWTAAGLPAGLGIDAATGVISGTPTGEGNATVVVTADDTTSVAQKTFSLQIGPPKGRYFFGGNQPGVSLSGDGHWIAYVRMLQSNGIQDWDVMLRNTVIGNAPVRISQNIAGTMTSCVHHTDRPGISDDGRYVTFSSCSRLTPTDTNNYDDVYLYDRVAGGLTLVAGTTGGRAGPVSNDGRYVVTFDGSGLFRHDMSGGPAVRVDTAADGTPGNGSASVEGARLSGDGQRIVFTSWSSNLAPADIDTVRDLFVKDLAHGTTTAVTAGLNDGGFRLSVAAGSVSDDGRIVAVKASGTDGQWRQMVLDRSTGEQLVLSRDANEVFVSADGTTVAYSQTNTVPGTPGIGGSPETYYGAAYLGHIATGPLALVEAQNLSLNADGTEPRVYGDRPWVAMHGLSDDGSAELWWSSYGYQVPGAGGGGYFLDRR